ncbi:Ulp1 family isopeptidase [Mesorhizobium onobrychidis]|nr:Ulp1 family isopeptidase [Mesorhizobium onobrychidis]
MPAGSAPQPSQSSRLLKRLSKLPLHPEDPPLILGFEEALIKANAAEKTVNSYVGVLVSFGHWLFAKNKDPIKDRLDKQSLVKDAREFIGKGDSAKLFAAIGHLSTGGVVRIRANSPYPQDAALIKEYRNEARIRSGGRIVTALRSFSDYLRQNNKKGIVGRLSDEALDRDAEGYRKDCADPTIGSALAQLRKSDAGATAMELERHIPPVPDPEDAALTEPRRGGEAIAQHSASQEVGSWPEKLAAAAHDQDVLLGLMDEQGLSSSAPQPARSARLGRNQPLYPEDTQLILGLKEAQEAALIKEYRDEAAIPTSKRNATAGKALAGGDQRIGSALASLRKPDAGAKAMERERHIPPVPDPEDAALMQPRRVGDAAAQHSAPHEASGWPKETAAAAHDQDVPLERIDQPGQSSSAPQPAQSTRLRRQRPREQKPLYPQDASLILDLEKAFIKANASDHTVKNNVGILRRFGGWLFEKNKTSIVARLNSTSLSDGGGVLEFIGEGDPSKLVAALDHLRTFQSTGRVVLRASRAKRNPRPQNVTLINSEGAAPTESRRVGDAAAQHGASHQAGNWAQKLPAKAHDQDVLLGLMDQPGLSSSLEPAAHHDQAPDPGVSNHQRSPDELMGAPAWSNLLPSEEVLIEDELDTAELRPAKRQRILDDLQGLAAERQLSEIANSGGRLLSPAATHQLGASPWEARPMMQGSGYEDAAAPHAIATSVGDAAAQQGPVSWPSVGAEGYDQDLMVEDGPPWSGVPPEQAQDIAQAGWQEAARSTSTWSLQMPLNFDWSMWPTSEPAPVHYVRARSETYGDFEAAVDPNPPGPVPGHHQDARQPGSPLALSPLPDSSDEEAMAWLSEELERRQMLRDTEWQTMMQGTGSAAVPGAGEPNEVQLIHHPRPRPMGEAAPAAPARAPQPASPVTASLPGTYRGLPVVDVTLTTSSSDAQIGAFGPTASSKVANGSVLGATEWLSDAHIQRDYHLLEGQLQGINPELAARTRLVDPSVSHLLRHVGSNTAQHTLQSIYNQNTAPADFLFLSVNNGTLDRPGTHWSLLLVDRREPEIPVAYHYDSRQREGYNDGPATQLAGLLNATLAPARMARQPNDYDCGVFVLEGTRALLGRLLDGQRPEHEPLQLDDLVADRPALQDRLRRRLPHEQEPRQLLDDEPASPPMMAFEPGELRQLLEDEPASPPMMAFDSAELWRLLEDEPASPPMMAFEPGELRQLLEDEPASSSPRINSTRHARTDGVHQPTQAPWPPQRKT